MNENPVVQVVLVGILLLVVGFLLMTRVFSSGSDSTAETEPTATDPVASATTDSSPEAAEAVAEAEATDATADAAASDSSPIPGADGAPVAEAPTGEFVAGPGLPEAVVAAHESGDTVVLLVTRHGGTDDKRMKQIVGDFRGQEGVAVFRTSAMNAAEYARITEGVDLNRTPALVVVSPPSASKGPLPEASISYAYRDHEGVAQAIRDAGYKGPQLPYHPE